MRNALGVDEAHTVGDALHLLLEVLSRHTLERQPDLRRRLAVHRVSGECEALRPLRPEVVEPHLIRQATEVARRGECEGGVLRAHDEVAQARDVVAASETVAMDTGDDGLVHVEELHAVVCNHRTASC